MKDTTKAIVGGTLAVIGATVLVSVGVWAFRVATSDVKGRGDAEIRKNSAVNRVAAQERFEDLYQEVLTADQRVDAAAAAVKADPSSVNKTNMTGATAYCFDVVGDYNAEARKFGSAEFRAFDLPASIDQLDPSTDCKESHR